MSQTVLVTGSSSGFGKLIAKTLSAAGHTVFASMRAIRGKNAAAAEELQNWAATASADLSIIELDVTQTASVQRAVAALIEKTGRIDVVVNNAGIMNIGANEAFTIDNVRQIYDVNVFGPFRVNKAVLPHMRRQRSGLLIHISSTVGRILFPFIGIYASSKFALEALAESYRYDLSQLGIDSVIVEPGAFPTALAEKGVAPGDPEVQSEYPGLENNLKRLGNVFVEMFSGQNVPDPQEVAAAVQRLVELPPGQRPRRTVVDPVFRREVETLNQTAARVQLQVLTAMKLADLEK